MRNNFDQYIKQSLDSLEAEYNPADWTDLQNKLGKIKTGKSSNSVAKGLMVAASFTVVAGLIYYFSISHTENKTIPVNSGVKEQKVDVANKNSIQLKQGSSEQTAIINDSPVTVSTNNKKNQSATNLDTKKNKASVNNPEENKLTATEKTVQSNSNSITENQTKTAEQPKEPSVANVLAAQPSIGSLKAFFHADLNLNKVCEGAAIQFVADNNDVPCLYKWSFGDGGTASEQNPSHVFAETGTYTVKLRVISTQGRKQADQQNTITVVAAPSVQVNYVVSEDNSLLVTFEADADRVIEWKWNFGDKQTASVQNPSHTYGRKGNYKAEVIAKNAAGCSTSIVKDVSLKSNLNLLAPNAFSPDGNGINDTWMPVALLNGDYTFTLTVFDKTGNIVFKTSDKNHPWEGQNTNKGDTFIWRAIVKDKNGDETPCQGLITISE